MRKKSIYVDIVLLLLLTVGFFWRVIFQNKFLFFGGDLINFYYEFYSASVQKAFLLTIIKNIKLNLFYPFNFVVSLVIHLTKDFDLGFRLIEFSFIIHFFLLATFTYFLIRFGFLLTRLAALFGAIAFSFSGVFVTNILNFQFYYSIAWMPLIFFLYLRCLKRNKVIDFLDMGLIILISIFTGSLYGLFYSALLILAFFFFELFYNNQIDSKNLIFKTLFVLMFILVFGGGWLLFKNIYCSVPLIYNNVAFVIIPSPRGLFLLTIMPNLAVKSNGWWEILVYLGTPTLFFVSLGLIFLKDTFKNNEEICFFAFFSIIFSALIILLLKQENFLSFYYNFMPRLEVFNYPNRLRILSNFSLIIVASFGFDLFCRYSETKREIFKKYILLWIVIITLIAGIIIPRYFMNVIINFSNSSINKLNNICWSFIIIFLCISIMTMNLFKKSRILCAMIIFLLVIDVFSFWTNLNPFNYRYGFDWNIKPPSKYFQNIKE